MNFLKDKLRNYGLRLCLPLLLLLYGNINQAYPLKSVLLMIDHKDPLFLELGAYSTKIKLIFRFLLLPLPRYTLGLPFLESQSLGWIDLWVLYLTGYFL